MKKLILALSLVASAAPVLAYTYTLRSCTLISTMNGIRYLGTYCNAMGECIKQVTVEYCPLAL